MTRTSLASRVGMPEGRGQPDKPEGRCGGSSSHPGGSASSQRARGALRPGRRDSRPPSLPLKRPAAAKPQQDNRSSSQKSEGSESHAAPRRGKAPRERLCLAGRSPGGRQALRNEGPGVRSTRPVPREGSAADWPRAGLEAQHLWAPENLRGRGSGQAAGELHLKPPTRHCRSGFVLLSS